VISKIDTIQSANDVIMSRLRENNPLFLPLDKYTHHALTNDQFDILRTATEVEYDEFIRNYLELVDKVHNVSTFAFTGYSIHEQDANSYMIYPHSRSHLYNSVYSDMLPSLFSVYFNLLKQTGKLKQFGTGVGKAFIINTENFTKDEYSSLRNMDYKEIIDLMVTVTEQIAKQNTDVEYLVKKVITLTEEKELLIAEINRLNQLVINTSITTWR